MDVASGFAVKGDMDFSATVSQSFRAGFEIVPNRNDIRYYLKRCAYRAGVYYDQEYYKVNGNNIHTYGITLGVTLPVFRWYNGISFGLNHGSCLGWGSYPCIHDNSHATEREAIDDQLRQLRDFVQKNEPSEKDVIEYIKSLIFEQRQLTLF